MNNITTTNAAVNWYNQLKEFGFNEEQILDALSKRQFNSIEEAVEYIVNNVRPIGNIEEHKMVLVVRDDLRMGKGKIAAQCCHAAVGVYRKIHHSTSNENWRQWLYNWEHVAEAKVAVKCNSEKELDDLEKRAIEMGLPTMVIVDAGRTQIAPNSKTVLAIGPAPVSIVNQVTGHLKLL
jgi:PTH2 family peptidyl-tRNA hydrolase